MKTLITWDTLIPYGNSFGVANPSIEIPAVLLDAEDMKEIELAGADTFTTDTGMVLRIEGDLLLVGTILYCRESHKGIPHESFYAFDHRNGNGTWHEISMTSASGLPQG